MPPKISATKFSTKKPKTPTKSIAPVKRNASNSKCKKALIVVTTGKVQAKAVSKGDKKKVVNRKTIIAKATVNVKMVLKKKVQKKTETQVAAGGKGVGKKGQIQGQKAKAIQKEKEKDDSYPPYRTLKQNLYRSPCFRETVHADDLAPCKCTPEQGCDEECENRMLYMECVPGHCPSLRGKEVHCGNMCLQTGLLPVVEVWKTVDKGWGLRVKQAVGADTVLVEYLGEVITTGECLSRMGTYKKTDDFYFAGLGGGLMLDAKPAGSLARFANHSCDPNCRLVKWEVMGESRIALMSNESLAADTEITYNYRYSEDGLSVPRQTCQCGAACCAGTIGGKVVVNEAQRWLERAEWLLAACDGTRKSKGVRVTEDVLSAHLAIAEGSCAITHPPGELSLALETSTTTNAATNSTSSSNNKGKQTKINASTSTSSSSTMPPPSSLPLVEALGSAVYRDLSALLQAAREWDKRAMEMRRSKSPVDVSLAVALLQEVKVKEEGSGGVKPKECVPLEAVVRRVLLLEKAIERFEGNEGKQKTLPIPTSPVGCSTASTVAATATAATTTTTTTVAVGDSSEVAESRPSWARLLECFTDLAAVTPFRV